MKNSFIIKSKSTLKRVNTSKDINASKHNREDYYINKHSNFINHKERIFKIKVDENLENEIIERRSIFKKFNNRDQKETNMFNKSIFKQSNKEEIIELSDDSCEKGELIGKYVDSIKINTQNASINEEIDPCEDEIIEKLLAEKRNDTYNEESIEDSSLSNLGKPITEEEKNIQDEIALIENEIMNVKRNIHKIDVNQRKINKLESKLMEKSKNQEVNNQIEWEIMPKTNQMKNGLDSDLEDILGKMSENDNDIIKSSNKKDEKLIEISDSFSLERDESVFDTNIENNNSLQVSEVTLDVKKSKLTENKEVNDQELNREQLNLKAIKNKKEEVKDIHRKVIPNQEKIKIYLMKELDKSNESKSSNMPSLNKICINLNQENLPDCWKRLLLDIKTVEEDISLCHLTNDKKYLAIYEDRLLLLEKLVESINYHTKKEEKTLTEEDEQAAKGWFTQLISNLRTKVVNSKTLRQFLNKIVKKFLDNQLLQKEILFMRFNLIIH